MQFNIFSYSVINQLMCPELRKLAENYWKQATN